MFFPAAPWWPILPPHYHPVFQRNDKSGEPHQSSVKPLPLTTLLHSCLSIGRCILPTACFTTLTSVWVVNIFLPPASIQTSVYPEAYSHSPAPSSLHPSPLCSNSNNTKVIFLNHFISKPSNLLLSSGLTPMSLFCSAQLGQLPLLN